MSALLLLGLVTAAAPSLTVDVTGKCPSAEAVAVALGSAVGTETAAPGKDVPKVIDRGDRFSVSAFGQAREYADPARDCDERARAAAVFIALALNPPAAPPSAPPPAVVQAPPPPPPPESARWMDVGVAARVDGTPDTSFALGFEVRAAAGWRWLGLAATAGILAPTDSQFSSVTVRQQRFPLSLAVIAQHRIAERVGLAGGVGVALVPLTLHAQGIDGAPASTRLDVGARIAIELRVLATPRLAPFIGVHAEIFPRAYQLDVDPLGYVGSTGRFWLGGSLGLSFEALPSPSRRREPNQVSASL